MMDARCLFSVLLCFALAACGSSFEQPTSADSAPDTLVQMTLPTPTSTFSPSSTPTPSPPPTETLIPTVTSEPLPTTCFDGALLQSVQENYLQKPETQAVLQKAEYVDLEPWDALMRELRKDPTEFMLEVSSILPTGSYSGQTFLLDTLVIGTTEISLDGQPEIGEGAIGHCVVVASPALDGAPIPILYGIQQGTKFSQLIKIILTVDPWTVKSLETVVEANSYFDSLIGETLRVWPIMRLESPDLVEFKGWLFNHDLAFPMLKNPNGYIWKYTNDPRLLSGFFKEILLDALAKMNLEMGGDVALLTTEVYSLNSGNK